MTEPGSDDLETFSSVPPAILTSTSATQTRRSRIRRANVKKTKRSSSSRFRHANTGNGGTSIHAHSSTTGPKRTHRAHTARHTFKETKAQQLRQEKIKRESLSKADFEPPFLAFSRLPSAKSLKDAPAAKARDETFDHGTHIVESRAASEGTGRIVKPVSSATERYQKFVASLRKSTESVGQNQQPRSMVGTSPSTKSEKTLSVREAGKRKTKEAKSNVSGAARRSAPGTAAKRTPANALPPHKPALKNSAQIQPKHFATKTRKKKTKKWVSTSVKTGGSSSETTSLSNMPTSADSSAVTVSTTSAEDRLSQVFVDKAEVPGKKSSARHRSVAKKKTGITASAAFPHQDDARSKLSMRSNTSAGQPIHAANSVKPLAKPKAGKAAGTRNAPKTCRKTTTGKTKLAKKTGPVDVTSGSKATTQDASETSETDYETSVTEEEEGPPQPERSAADVVKSLSIVIANDTASTSLFATDSQTFTVASERVTPGS